MLKKVINYVDFEGKEGQDTLYFNLTEPEVVRLDVEFPGGLEKYIGNLDDKARPDDILSLFEKVLRIAYGEKSDDGRYFLKSDKSFEMFYQSAAYAALFVELLTDADKAAAFFTDVLSKTTVDSEKAKTK